MNILRWVAALAILPLTLAAIFMLLSYPFEWIVSILIGRSLFFYIVLWIFFGPIIPILITWIGSIIVEIPLLLVRRTRAFKNMLFFAVFALVIFLIYGAWSSDIEFSWEAYRYDTLNRVIFTLFALGVFHIPLTKYSE